jgi:hypothetical protein
MNIESIKNQVENEGHFTFYHKARLVVTIDGEKNETTGEISRELLCYVYISNDKFVVEHYDGAIPVLEETTSDTQVLSTIRELSRLRL